MPRTSLEELLTRPISILGVTDRCLFTDIYTGFDSIFFLRHCNVNRLFAIWEYLYPKYWIEKGWKSKTGEIIPFTTTGVRKLPHASMPKSFASASFHHHRIPTRGSHYQDHIVSNLPAPKGCPAGRHSVS